MVLTINSSLRRITPFLPDTGGGSPCRACGRCGWSQFRHLARTYLHLTLSLTSLIQPRYSAIHADAPTRLYWDVTNNPAVTLRPAQPRGVS